MIINTFGFPKRNLLRRGKREAGSTRNARQVVRVWSADVRIPPGLCFIVPAFVFLTCPVSPYGVPYDARDSMQPNRIHNLRSQIAANRYRKSKDEHTATEAYNYLTPDANTRYTKVSDYLHAPLPKVSKKSGRALVASGRNLIIGTRQGLLQLFDSDIAAGGRRTVAVRMDS